MVDDGRGGLDGPAAPATSSGSSLYTHPLGSIGRRKRSGIFVVFLDEIGQSIDQDCGFRTIEVNIDHAPGWCGSRSDR